MAACDTLQHAMISHGLQGQAHCQEQAPNSTPRYQRCVWFALSIQHQLFHCMQHSTLSVTQVLIVGWLALLDASRLRLRLRLRLRVRDQGLKA